MEEMQKAFNKTIIKLQNTSRIAEEQVGLALAQSDQMKQYTVLTRCRVLVQDQKQTESIQVLQNQLENVTKLMLNLTKTVSQLQREVTHLLPSVLLISHHNMDLCLFNYSGYWWEQWSRRTFLCLQVQHFGKIVWFPSSKYRWNEQTGLSVIPNIPSGHSQK